MKRLFYLLIVAAVAVGCDENNTSLEIFRHATITFEGNEWNDVVATNSSSFDFMTEDYVWEDSATSLTSRPKFASSEWGSFYGGGCTVSNFGSGDLADKGSYAYDLYVYNADADDVSSGCGADGSNNFLVFYDNLESLTAVVGVDCHPEIYFRDGKARIIEKCQINATTYFVNIVENGNEFSPKLAEDEQITLYATGYDAAGLKTATAVFTLATYGSTTKSWTEWDLSSLGEVVRVSFSILGGYVDDYGMTTPKYFAMDNIRVKWVE